MKKSKIALTVSLLLAMSNGIALLPVMPGLAADGTVSSPMDFPGTTTDPVAGNTSGNGTAKKEDAGSTSGTTGSSAPKVDTENWPWMEKEKPSGSDAGSLKTETPKAETPAPDKGSASSSQGSGPMQMETPKLGSPASVPPPAAGSSAGGLKSEAPVAASAQPVHKAPLKLFGRIEQIETRGAPAFPIVLKAQQAKMDTRGTQTLAGRETEFSGRAVGSFPLDMSGNWGGALVLQQVLVEPSYYQVDPEEAKRTVQALHVGTTGNVNFVFQNLGSNKVALQPAQIMFMVAGKDTMAADQIKQMMGGMGAGNPFGGMLSQMVNSMPIPIVLHLGDIDTAGQYGETGVSGNQLEAHVIRNTIRQLAPGVLEQQIVTEQRTVDPHTHRAHQGYGETVVRFTQRGAAQMYAQAACVNYGADKRCLEKIMLAGWINRGQVVQSNPYSAMPGMMPGMGSGTVDPRQMQQMQQQMQQMMGGQGGQGQMPGMDMLKGLFGQ